MRVMINQPCPFATLYLWNRLVESDVLIHLVSAQFVRRQAKGSCAYVNGYELIISGRRTKLTIPTLHSGTQKVAVRDVQIDYFARWLRTHLRSIRMSYSKTPFFDEVFPVVQSVLVQSYPSIADLSIASTKAVMDYLGLQTKVLLDVDVASRTGDASTWMLDLVSAVGGTRYCCGQWAVDNYLNKEAFAKRGVAIAPQNWHHPEYGAGERNLSILDVLFRMGKQSLNVLQSQHKDALCVV